MSTPLPYLGYTSAENVANVRLVLGAMGRGFAGFATPLVALGDNAATPETTPTGYCQFDNTADSDHVAELQALCAGDVPGLDMQGNPILWGENGLISQADAIAAFSSNKVTVVSAAGQHPDDFPTFRANNVAVGGYKLRPTPDP